MRVAILGGGLIGLSSAHALLAAGHEVVVVERDVVGGGATPGNAGWVCPSQVGPLAAPGMLTHSVGMLIKPTSALYIAPRLDSNLVRFMLAFAKRCTIKAHTSAVTSLVALAQTVDEDFTLLEKELGTSLRQRRGVLSCFTDSHHARKMHGEWSQVPRLPGTEPGPLLDAAGIAALEPTVSDRVVAGFLLEQDSHLDPVQLAASLRSAVTDAGATIVEKAGDCELLRSGARVTGIRTASAGTITADEVVLAAGAGSRPYLRELGIRVPMVAGYGYSFTVQPDVMPQQPLHLEEAHVACTPLDNGLRVAGTMEISGRMAGIDQRRVEAIVGAASSYIGGVDWSQRTEVWGGPRPVTSDGMPLIGRPNEVAGCVVATGHGMYGVTYAATTGRLVAEIVSGSRGPAALSPSRRR